MNKVFFTIPILVFTFLSFPIQAQVNLDSGLVALYLFNGFALDESGNGLDGNVSGAAVVPDRFGNPNSAFSFDGIDDRIFVPNSGGLLNFLGEFTLSVWVYPRAVGDGDARLPVISKSSVIDDNKDNYRINFHTDMTFNYSVEDSTDDIDYVIPSGAHPLNAWYHIIGRYDESDLEIYINGVKEGSLNIGSIPLFTGPAPLEIGNNLSSNHVDRGVFDGVIDDLWIFNRALNEDEITELYGGGVPVAVEESFTQIPADLELQQNHPNPFDHMTNISYTLPKGEFTTLSVFDLLGREVQVLVSEFQLRGSYSFDFDANHLNGGVYFSRLNTGRYTLTKKMVLLR